MSTHKYIDKICVAAVLLALVITVLFMNGEKLGIEKVVNEDAEQYSATAFFTSNDLNSADLDFSEATSITLDGEEAHISGSGAYVLDHTVTIVRSGYYTVSGSTETCRINVDAEDYSKVWIEFNGVSISCADDAALQIENADKVFLVLARCTSNSLSSGSAYSDEAVEAGHDGTIYARDDLTITGYGELSVTSAFRHAIVGNDDLAVTGGTISVISAADGIHANNSFRFCNASLAVSAEDEGIQTDEAESFIYMESGTITLTSTDDGIKSAGDITIDGGTFELSSGDDGIRSDTAVTINNGTILIRECYEGIEAPAIDINGGDITIYPEDDGINANGGTSDMMQMGGPMGEMTGGPMGGPSQDGSSDPSQGTQNTAPSPDASLTPSALESAESTPQNQETISAPQDEPLQDGYSIQPIEAQNTADAVSAGTESTSSQSDAETEESYIRITGGRITIVNETARDADGLDSNGSVYISGGEIYISLTGSGSNNAIDYASENQGTALISGGTVIASGSYSMAESFSSESEQVSLMYNITEGVEAGALVTITDAKGNTLISHTVPCSFSSIIISSPDLVQGEQYTVSFNDMEETITLEEVSSSFGDAASSMFGGNHSFSDMRRREDGTQGEEMPQGFNPENAAGPSGQMPQDGAGMRPHGGRPGGKTDGGMPTEGMPGMPEDANREGMMPQMPSEAQKNAEASADASVQQETEAASAEPTAPGEEASAQENQPDSFEQNHPQEGTASEEMSAQTEASPAAEVTEGPAAVTSVQWILLGSSAIVLILGIVIVNLLKSRNIFS